MDGSKASEGTITSIDGSRTITVEEFDRLFDEGSDEIDHFIDWSRAERLRSVSSSHGERVYVSFEVSRDLLDRLDAEAKRRGLSSGALAVEWIAARLHHSAAE